MRSRTRYAQSFPVEPAGLLWLFQAFGRCRCRFAYPFRSDDPLNAAYHKARLLSRRERRRTGKRSSFGAHDPFLTLPCSGRIVRATSSAGAGCKAMGRHPAAKPVRLQRMLFAALMYLLCLVSLGFVDRRTIAQEVGGQDPRHMTTDPTVLTLEQEKAQAAKPGSDFK